MPKLVDLTKVKSEADLPGFKVPKWIRPRQIVALMQGTVSDSEEDDIVHITTPDVANIGEKEE